MTSAPMGGAWGGASGCPLLLFEKRVLDVAALAEEECQFPRFVIGSRAPGQGLAGQAPPGSKAKGSMPSTHNTLTCRKPLAHTHHKHWDCMCFAMMCVASSARAHYEREHGVHSGRARMVGCARGLRAAAGTTSKRGLVRPPGGVWRRWLLPLTRSLIHSLVWALIQSLHPSRPHSLPHSLAHSIGHSSARPQAPYPSHSRYH